MWEYQINWKDDEWKNYRTEERAHWVNHDRNKKNWITSKKRNEDNGLTNIWRKWEGMGEDGELFNQ